MICCRLLFVSFTNRENLGKSSAFENDMDTKPIPLARNLSSIYAKYPHYDASNSMVISNFSNELEDFQRNDLVIPEYNPLVGKTDFLDDKHLRYLSSYLKFLFSLDKTISPDIRNKMEAYSYE